MVHDPIDIQLCLFEWEAMFFVTELDQPLILCEPLLERSGAGAFILLACFAPILFGPPFNMLNVDGELDGSGCLSCSDAVSTR